MKILLQNRRTKFYFRSCHAWTSNPDAAFDFETSRAALEFVEKRKLCDVQLVLRTESPERVEAVPVEDAAA